MNDLDAARSRHFAVAPKPVVGGEPDVCLTCDTDWPCDFAQAIAALDALKEQYLAMVEAWSKASQSDQAARDLADDLGRMLSEACWAIDHACTQCGERQPAHTPRCPTYLALTKWEASRAK